MSDFATVTLGGSLGLKDAVRLRAELLAALEGHAAVTLDCSALTEGDAAIVQLLVAAKKTANAGGVALTLKVEKTGVLGQLCIKTGLMSADGRALVPDIDLFASAQGKAA
jgi:anti-anti-sigma regulatory factor